MTAPAAKRWAGQGAGGSRQDSRYPDGVKPRLLLVAVAIALVAACAPGDGPPGSGPSSAADDAIATAPTCAQLAPYYQALFQQLAARASGRPLAEFELPRGTFPFLIIWFDDSVTETAAGDLGADVATWEGVEAQRYYTQAMALAEFREMFADEPELIEAAEADPSVLPTSLRLIVAPRALQELHERLATTPGVTQITEAAPEPGPFLLGVFDPAAVVTGLALVRWDLDDRLRSIGRRAQDLSCSPDEIVGGNAFPAPEGAQLAVQMILYAARHGFGLPDS